MLLSSLAPRHIELIIRASVTRRPHMAIYRRFVKKAFPYCEDQCNLKKGCIKKRVAGKKQQCAVASLDDHPEQPLNMCLDLSPHILVDNLNSDWDNSTPDSSLPTGVSWDARKCNMDISAGVSYFPSDRSTPSGHVFNPPSPRHSPNVRDSPLCSQPVADDEVFTTYLEAAPQAPPPCCSSLQMCQRLGQGCWHHVP